MPLTSRRATPADADLLGELGFQLIEDEGQEKSVTVQQMQEQMRVWLDKEYSAVIFKMGKEVLVYALYREEPEHIYLRQFFVKRHGRRMGFGKESIAILRKLYWPPGKRLVLEVLVSNADAIAFYKAIGFREQSVTLEIPAS